MSDNTIEVTSANFDEVVGKASVPVVLDFWAEWCGPCKAMAPVLDEYADEKQGDVVVGKVNVDEERDLAVKYGIRSIPTLIVFKGGEEAARQVGQVRKNQLSDFVASVG